MRNLWSRVVRSTTDTPVVIIRASVGLIFLSEGIQKFLFPESVGAGRFEKIGLPSPELLAPVVGSFEIACGHFILIGLLTRLASTPLVIVMLTAISSTKIPILLESGFWKMAHEARTDFSMLLSLIFLLIVGSCPFSLDKVLWQKKVGRWLR